jgi:hypothetical protein
LGRALAVQVQQVKREEHELICAAFIHGSLETTENRHAV